MEKCVAIDVSQVFAWPARSGVQRVLLGLLTHWPSDRLPARCVFESGGRLYSASLSTIADSLQQHFLSTSDPRESEEGFRQVVWHARGDQVPARSIPRLFHAWLLPEPTYQSSTLRRIRGLPDGVTTGAIAMDIFPELAIDRNPPSPRHSAHSEYFRMLTRVDSCVAISDRTAADVEIRLRRPGPIHVATPGVDHIRASRRATLPTPSFVALSTISPRKRIDILVRGFIKAASVNREIGLTVIGQPGYGSTETIRALEQAQRSGLTIRWIRDATDPEVWRLLGEATASFTIGQEGYGLAAPESLAAGCPVVAASDLPSVSAFVGSGVLSLPRVDEESVAAAMIALSDPAQAKSLEASIPRVGLPTWLRFAETVAESLDASAIHKRQARVAETRPRSPNAGV